MNTLLYDNGNPKKILDSHCVFLSITLTDSIFKMSNNYYPQVFL